MRVEIKMKILPTTQREQRCAVVSSIEWKIRRRSKNLTGNECDTLRNLQSEPHSKRQSWYETHTLTSSSFRKNSNLTRPFYLKCSLDWHWWRSWIVAACCGFSPTCDSLPWTVALPTHFVAIHILNGIHLIYGCYSFRFILILYTSEECINMQIK